MEVKGWENKYNKEGEVQFGILPKVKKVASLLQGRGHKKILDLGCGTGRHSLFFAELGFDVYATDISKTGINIASNKAIKQGYLNIKFSQHDMKEIPFEDDFFDAVICILAIDHGTKADLQKTVNEIRRVVKGGGIVMADFLSREDETYGRGRSIEDHTFIDSIKGESGIVHHYSSKGELNMFFAMFEDVSVASSQYAYTNNRGEAYIVKSWDVIAIK